MSSALLIFDLIGRDPALESERNARGSSIQNLMTVKKRLGLLPEQRVNLVPGDKASPNADGSHHSDFVPRTPVAINTSLCVLTCVSLGKDSQNCR